jgi:hypothetical protein
MGQLLEIRISLSAVLSSNIVDIPSCLFQSSQAFNLTRKDTFWELGKNGISIYANLLFRIYYV